MSIARNPTGPRVTAGLDWAKDDHAICVVGDQGHAIDRFTVAHDAAGLKRMAARLLRAGRRRLTAKAQPELDLARGCFAIPRPGLLRLDG